MREIVNWRGETVTFSVLKFERLLTEEPMPIKKRLPGRIPMRVPRANWLHLRLRKPER